MVKRSIQITFAYSAHVLGEHAQGAACGRPLGSPGPQAALRTPGDQPHVVSTIQPTTRQQVCPYFCRDPGGTRAGPGRDPSRTRTHRSAKLRPDGAPRGPGVQLRSSPHARTAHQGAARRSWGTERCVGLSHSGCNSARSLLTRVPAGSLPGPSRVPNRVKKKRFARGTRCFGASKRSSNDTEPWSVSLLHRAAAARAPHSLYLTRCSLFEGRKGKIEGFGGGTESGGKLVATWWQLPYLSRGITAKLPPACHPGPEAPRTCAAAL